MQLHEAAAPKTLSQHQEQLHTRQQGILGRVAAAAAAAALVCAPMVVAPDAVLAADSVKIGTCLLQKCQKQLAQCLGDPKCFQNIVCLNTCNAAEDEAGCQIRSVA
jgi:violaxanthin de-epoxidase